jgi:hypothetical protein
MRLYPDLPLYVPRDLFLKLEPFAAPELYRLLKLYPESTPLPPGLYLLHSWPHVRQRESAAVNEDLMSMPVAVAIDRDHRTASFFALPPPGMPVLGEVRVRTR